MGPQEIEPHEVRLAFRRLTGRQLPRNPVAPHAIADSGRTEAVFVRFQTDEQGIDYVLKTFGGAQDGPAAMDGKELAEVRGSSASVFADALAWQTELGLSLYDQAAVESAQPFTSQSDGTRYAGLIDRQSGTVFLFADRRAVMK
jgi:hypothetical protein